MVKIYYLESNDGEIRYIGKTFRSLNERLGAHLRDKKTYKGKWLNSLTERPNIKLLDEVIEEDANFWEIYWISQFKQWGFRLTNLTIGGDGGKGFKHTEETKKIIGEHSKKRKCDAECARKISESKKGKKFPKLSESMKGRKHSEEHKRKIGEKSKGRKHSEETKKMISDKLKGRKKPPRTEEHKNKISETLKNITTPHQSLEALRKYNEARKKNTEWHTKETKKKISESNMGHIVTEETRKKISKNGRKYGDDVINKIKNLLNEGLNKEEISNELGLKLVTVNYLIKRPS